MRNPDDAVAAGLTDGGFVRLRSAHGSCPLKVTIANGQRRGSLRLRDELLGLVEGREYCMLNNTK
jgi:hypothetical protein